MAAPKYFTYKNMSRMTYMSLIPWAIIIFFMPDMWAFMCGVDPKAIQGVPNAGDGLFILYFSRTMICVWLTFWAGISQCSDWLMRKCLWTMVAWTVGGLTVFIVNRDVYDPMWMYTCLPHMVMFFCLYTYTLLVANKTKPTAPKSGESKRMTYTFWYFAVCFFFWGVGWMAFPHDTFANVGGTITLTGQQQALLRFWGVLVLHFAAATACYAKASASDQKKMMQYSFAAFCVFVVNASFTGASWIKKDYNMFVFFFFWLVSLLVLCVWAAYGPSNWAQFLLRTDYIMCGAFWVMLTCNPDMYWTFWKSTVHDAAASMYLGSMMLFIVLAEMAVAQFDDALQRKFLCYTNVAKCLFVVLGLAGKFTAPLKVAAMGSACALTFLVLYTPKYAIFDFFRDESSKMKRASSSPMRSMMKKRS